jgi:hypothetical protein
MLFLLGTGLSSRSLLIPKVHFTYGNNDSGAKLQHGLKNYSLGLNAWPSYLCFARLESASDLVTVTRNGVSLDFSKRFSITQVCSRFHLGAGPYSDFQHSS